jgi:hypothetical protein
VGGGLVRGLLNLVGEKVFKNWRDVKKRCD